MIRVHRGDEPQSLVDVRAGELPRVRALAAAKVPPDRLTADEIGEKYQVAKEALWIAQGYKCAYCESKERLKRNDAEHLRPKTRANRSPGVTLDHGYWWLTWTWTNLFFGCRNCNQAPAKLDKFPLDHGSEALVPEQQPPGKERPLLLDPADDYDDGIDHIQFKPSTVHGQARWTPVARGGSPRGTTTIDVCKLDAPDLLTAYSAHVSANVEKEREVIEAAMDGGNGDLAAVWEAWECAILRLLSPEQPFVGLSYDALDHFFPADVRARWGLTLRKPQ